VCTSLNCQRNKIIIIQVQFLIRINSLKLGNSNETTNLSSTFQTVLGKIIRHLKIVISFYLSLLENGVLLSNL